MNKQNNYCLIKAVAAAAAVKQDSLYVYWSVFCDYKKFGV